MSKWEGINNGALHFAKEYGGSMLSEGVEEGLQTVLEPVVRSLTLGEEYEAAEAEEILYSFLLGAASAGMLEGGPALSNSVDTRENGRYLKGLGEDVLHAVVAEGLTGEPWSAGYQLAEKVQARQAAGEEISPSLLGRLWAETQTGRENLASNPGVSPEWSEEETPPGTGTVLQGNGEDWSAPPEEAADKTVWNLAERYAPADETALSPGAHIRPMTFDGSTGSFGTAGLVPGASGNEAALSDAVAGGRAPVGSVGPVGETTPVAAGAEDPAGAWEQMQWETDGIDERAGEPNTPARSVWAEAPTESWTETEPPQRAGESPAAQAGVYDPGKTAFDGSEEGQ